MSRFDKLGYDPRFKKLKKNASKVSIDSRFKEMLESKDFNSGAVVDKYGRKISHKNDLKKYYQMESLDFARGEGLSDSSSEEEEEEEEEQVVEQEEEQEEEEENIPRQDPTKRLAIVNLDWDHVKASLLFKVLNSFTNKGCIESVAIYLSDFGRQKLEEEANGPPQEIFNDKLIEEDQGEEFNNEELRKYQLDRLKYYYAIATCDAVSTAKSIYKSCDGLEFESSGNFFDVRYVPDDMTFDEPQDVATSEPTQFEPVEFTTDALQHSSVSLTWDQTDPERTKIMKKVFNKDSLQDMDVKAYLASSSEDELEFGEGEDKEAIKNKYLQLLAEGDDVFSKDRDQEIEITFTPGLVEKAQDAVEKLKQKDLSVFEKEQLQRKQKKKMKQQEEEMYDSDVPDDPFFQLSDPEFQEPKEKTQPKRKRKMDKKNMQELSLLVDDESYHYNRRDKKEDDFEIDTQDPRFSSLLDSHAFAIDPLNPQFKKTKNMAKVLEKRRNSHKVQEPLVPTNTLNSLVESVKRKNALNKKGK